MIFGRSGVRSTSSAARGAGPVERHTCGLADLADRESIQSDDLACRRPTRRSQPAPHVQTEHINPTALDAATIPNAWIPPSANDLPHRILGPPKSASCAAARP